MPPSKTTTCLRTVSRKLLLTGITTLTLLCQGTVTLAKPYLPPRGKVFTGVSGGEYPTGFNTQVRKHQAVFQTFTLWGYRPDRVIARSIASRARPMIHISTLGPNGEVITPRGI